MRRRRPEGAALSYQLTVSEKPGYLHFTVTGPNTVENVSGYLQDVLREAELRNCTSILIEERLTGRRLETWDVYQIAAGGGQHAGRLDAVANNRGLPMSVFETFAEAEAWLATRVAR
ncbi:MAG TPA: hypothetical protein VFR29_00105 [Steroidobacteraceae bacterium]|nr:hypothetical protein [Steroidobacteraceae bacterium]